MPRIVILFFVLLLSPAGFASQDCADLLLSNLRYFRSPVEFSEEQSGFYTDRLGQVIFVRDQSNEPEVVVSRILNSAAHREILRRQLGAKRFTALMAATDREQAFAEALKAEAEKINDDFEVSEDPEELKAAVSEYGRYQSLPPELEARVLKYLRSIQRLASPMSNWLKPKVLGGTLRQLPVELFEDPIERIATPDRLIYKAQLIKVFLNQDQEFILSAGASGMPDGVHQLVLESLLMVVPPERIRQTTPGYLVISTLNSKEPRHGIIEFLTKGLHKQTLFRENFDFRNR